MGICFCNQKLWEKAYILYSDYIFDNKRLNEKKKKVHLKNAVSLRPPAEKHYSIERNQVLKILVMSGDLFIHHPVLSSFPLCALLSCPRANVYF